MKKERIVLLMGAGAVLDFGAPSTCNLTKALLVDKKVGSINKRIYILLKRNKIYTDVNFESIIHFLDSFVNYLRSDFKSGFKDIYKAFTFLDGSILSSFKEIDNLDLLDCNDIKFNNKDYERVVKLLFYNYNHVIINEFQEQLAYSTLAKQKANLLKNWYDKNSEKNILRIYTTNYDRLIPYLIEDIFDGYDYVRKSLFSYSGYQPNIKKIVSERNIASCYNLHGSLHWSIPLFSDPTIWESHKNEIIPPSSYTKKFRNSEPNHANFMIPIITGYAKVRKAQIPPIRQFFYSFERDLMDADKIIIAGYSFSDDHINNIIDVALNENPKAKIDIIDYDKDGMNNNLLSKKLDEKLTNVNKNDTSYYMKGFIDYLKK